MPTAPSTDPPSRGMRHQVTLGPATSGTWSAALGRRQRVSLVRVGAVEDDWLLLRLQPAHRSTATSLINDRLLAESLGRRTRTNGPTPASTVVTTSPGAG